MPCHVMMLGLERAEDEAEKVFQIVLGPEAISTAVLSSGKRLVSRQKPPESNSAQSIVQLRPNGQARTTARYEYHLGGKVTLAVVSASPISTPI
ncbi:hypothetical protein CKAH01_16957 [Colletotrichum kahawae]|uniref:Uncharacterized protein n=1 Tax=Colletotrichum kahawae TaxID=34407 RepID=A0AAE0D7Q3_COLKA|nr:hypothetical protein CKAH01_16957 [Colletotrichum kahawae]